MRLPHSAFSLPFAALLSAQVAWSQTPGAEALIHEGVALRRSGRDAEALERFQRAHQQAPTPRTLAQMGFAEQALGRWADAEMHLQQSLDLGDDPWVRERRSLIEQALRDVGTHIGTLEVLCDAPSARVTIDDGTPIALPMASAVRTSAGVHHLALRAPGRQPLERDVEVRANEPTRASVTLAAEAPAAPIASPPVHPPPVPVAPAVVAPLPATPSTHAPSGEPQRVFGWVTLSVGVASLGMGAVSLLLRNGAADHWNSNACLAHGMTRQENCQADRSLGRTTEALSIAGFAAGGALLVTGAILVLTAPSARRPRLGINLSDGYFGLTLGGAM